MVFEPVPVLCIWIPRMLKWIFYTIHISFNKVYAFTTVSIYWRSYVPKISWKLDSKSISHFKIRYHEVLLKRAIKFTLIFPAILKNIKVTTDIKFLLYGIQLHIFGVDIHIREECRVYFWCCRSRYAVQLFLIMFALRILIRLIHGHPLIGQQPKINMVM